MLGCNWPEEIKINWSDIENVVKHCNICQTHLPTPPQTIIHPWECPSSPWTLAHVDHAGPFFSKYFFLLIDAYSCWMEVHIVNSTSAKSTVNNLQCIVSMHGLPQQLVSNNDPAFIMILKYLWTKMVSNTPLLHHTTPTQMS